MSFHPLKTLCSTATFSVGFGGEEVLGMANLPPVIDFHQVAQETDANGRPERCVVDDLTLYPTRGFSKSVPAVDCPKIPISNNVGRCQVLLSVLTCALRRARHFALAEAVPYPTKARSQSVSGPELSPTHPSLRSHARS